MNHELRIKNLALFLVILGIILPNFSFAQVSPEVKLPGTWEEIKEAGLKVLGFIPDFFRGIWEGFLSFCRMVLGWFKTIWNSYVFSFLNNLWQKTLGREIKERKPVIEEEFQKEKQEAGEEIKASLPTAKSIWERFKELIK